jgi:hypothetical protein
VRALYWRCEINYHGADCHRKDRKMECPIMIEFSVMLVPGLDRHELELGRLLALSVILPAVALVWGGCLLIAL